MTDRRASLLGSTVVAGLFACAAATAQTITPIPVPAPAPAQAAPQAPARPLVDAVIFEGDRQAGSTLRTPLSAGQTLAADLVIDQRYAVTHIPPDKAPSERQMTLKAGLVVEVKSVTPQFSTAELRFDRLSVDFSPATGEPFSIDAARPTDAAAGTLPGAMHAALTQLLGTKLTLTLAPDNTIAKVDGAQEIMKLNAARLLRRLIEDDGLRACVGPLLAARTMVPQVPEGSVVTTVPDGSWPVVTTILADRGRQPTTELRRVEKTEGPLTTVRGRSRVSTPPTNVARDTMYLRDASVDSALVWNTAAARLVSAKIDDAMTLILANPDDSRQAMTTITTTTITPRATPKAPG